MKGIFVTGTDTGVGKTIVSCGILTALRRRGLRVAGMKPVETGWDGSFWPDDANALREASGRNLPREHIVPYALRDALAPAAAAELAGSPIDPLVLAAAFDALAKASDLVVVEGAGGAAVPITPDLDYAQLAAAWDLAAVVICRPGLGTLNHARLTVEHLRAAGVPVLGLIVNKMPARPGLAEQSNLAWLPRVCGVPLLGVVPESQDADTAVQAVTVHVDVARLAAKP